MNSLSRKILAIVLVFFLTVGIFAPPAQARFLSYGWPKADIGNTRVPFRYFGSYVDTWLSPMNLAYQSWDSSGVNIEFYQSSSSSNTVALCETKETWFGSNQTVKSGSTLLEFQILLNEARIKSEATNLPNFIQSVFIHELAHSVYLADNPNTTSLTIMSYSRNRNVIMSLQSYDVQSLSVFYSTMYTRSDES